jgi:hypothetical protein
MAVQMTNDGSHCGDAFPEFDRYDSAQHTFLAYSSTRFTAAQSFLALSTHMKM